MASPPVNSIENLYYFTHRQFFGGRVEFGLDDGFHFICIGVFEALEPGGVCFFCDEFREEGQGLFAIAPNGHGRFHVLVNFGGVDIQVDDFGLFCVFVEATGDAVVEAHADGDEDIAFVREQVGTIISVHAEHADVEGVAGRQGAGAEDGPGCGDTAFLYELAEFLFCVAEDDALAEEDEGFFCFVDELCGFGDVFFADDGFWAIAANVFAGRITFVVKFLYLSVFGNVDEHGSRAAAAGDVEGFCQYGGDLGGVGHLVIPFCDGGGDVDDIGLLEGVGAKQVGEYLAGDADERGAIDLGVGEAGDQVGGAGPAGSEYDAGTAGGTGVALCGVDAALFVADQDVVEPIPVVIEGVIDRHDRAAGVAEDGVYAFGE